MKAYAWVLLGLTLAGKPLHAEQDFIVLQSTTSTQNSGLYDAILPKFHQATGINVRVVAVGSGQALQNAANCNGEVAIVHDPIAEKKFVEAGFADSRLALMRNEFVIVGPKSDPAGVRVTKSPSEAFQTIAAHKQRFVSRGDKSGTHSRELQIWEKAAVTPGGSWYRETGSGMGAALNIAVAMDAYTLTDQSSWITFRNKSNHRILYSGGSELSNEYSIITVGREKCRGLNTEAAHRFVNWMLSKDGQDAIRSYTVNDVPLFKLASEGQ